MGKTMEFTPLNEPWAAYKLANGAIVRFRIMLVRAVDTGALGPDSKPNIQLMTQWVADTEWPEEILQTAAKKMQ